MVTKKNLLILQKTFEDKFSPIIFMQFRGYVVVVVVVVVVVFSCNFEFIG